MRALIALWIARALGLDDLQRKQSDLEMKILEAELRVDELAAKLDAWV